MQTKPTFFISDSQFSSVDSDMPDMDLILESLVDIYKDLSTEDVWTHKGNYQLSFWADPEDDKTIFCNVYVLTNPDDPTDSTTEDSSYYFEITCIE